MRAQHVSSSRPICRAASKRPSKKRKSIICAMSCAGPTARRCCCSTVATVNGAAHSPARGKKAAVAELGEQTRAQETEPDVWLCFAPVKRARIDYIAEKATELGVSVLQPIVTRHTAVERVNVARVTRQRRRSGRTDRATERARGARAD